MQLPSDTQNLYRHWDDHLVDGKHPIQGVPDHFAWFIAERLSIWEKHTRKDTPPYTTDPILSSYRFCNVFREQDRQTIEIHCMLNPLRDDFPLWLMNMFYARLVARPATIEAVGLLSFDSKANEEVCKKLSTLPRPRYGTPYVFPVSTILKSETPTRELFLTIYLPTIIEKIAKEISSWEKESVSTGLTKILPLFGFNHHFLWTEVLIDVAYQYPEYIDLYKKFPLGPGSLPTFKTLSDHPEDFVHTLSKARYPTALKIGDKYLSLSAENWEGMGCEYRKYTNLSLGKGRKRRYH